eukprot:12931653-Prorocentrum_lima.AAC.1
MHCEHPGSETCRCNVEVMCQLGKSSATYGLTKALPIIKLEESQERLMLEDVARQRCFREWIDRGYKGT